MAPPKENFFANESAEEKKIDIISGATRNTGKSGEDGPHTQQNGGAVNKGLRSFPYSPGYVVSCKYC